MKKPKMMSTAIWAKVARSNEADASFDSSSRHEVCTSSSSMARSEPRLRSRSRARRCASATPERSAVIPWFLVPSAFGLRGRAEEPGQPFNTRLDLRYQLRDWGLWNCQCTKRQARLRLRLEAGAITHLETKGLPGHD